MEPFLTKLFTSSSQPLLDSLSNSILSMSLRR
jgi:hypothetical protein